MNNYINLTVDNVDKEHLCCAISDKKHQKGVDNKKSWIKEQIKDGHVFRKLDANGKIFIEYAPLDKAWCSAEGKNFMYIYCLWVAGSFKNKGYAKELLKYAVDDAKNKNMSGICTISSKKKKPFVSEKTFFEKNNFKVVDNIGEYELLSLSFDGTEPHFTPNAKKMALDDVTTTIFYSLQCPYTSNSISEIKEYANENNIKVNICLVDSLESAKQVPCVFNNWATFVKGKFVSNTLLNKNSFMKLLNE